MKFLNLQQRLQQRRQQGLYRQRPLINGCQQSEVLADEKALVNFASNDYLALANNQTAVKALANSANQFGFGSGGSHLICGHQPPHQILEHALAEFVERDAALTFCSGYMANLAIIQSLTTKGDIIFSDKLNHASIVDGIRLSAADSKRYPHCDMAALAKRLSKAPQNKFVVSDSVFSMDGDLAPLKEMVALCEKYDAILIVDDAHGFGVIGEQGKGVGEHFGFNQKQLPVLMATLGKGLGGYGAFVAGEKSLIDYLIQFARSYIYTTAMPAAIASANLANLQTLQNNPQMRLQLQHNIEYFKQQCQQHNINLMPSLTAIQPLLIGDSERLMKINQHLRTSGILVGAIRPPTVPANSARLRITLTAGHNQQQIDRLVSALSDALACS